MSETAAQLIRRDVDLAAFTTYKVGGPAARFAEVGDEAELRAVLAEANGEEVLLLGRGSNLVVSDRGFPGLVIRLVGRFNEASMEDGYVVSAGGGVALPRLARFAAEHDRGGLEFFVGIPGSVGGAVRMNAGGHGSDTATWLDHAIVLDRHTLTTTARTPADLDLGYRHSNLGDDEIVLAARFTTVERPREESEALLRDITRWRKQHQPGGTLNAGSVFKNPPGDSAGRIIDALGLKGYRRGSVAVSELHANFFVADKGATAQDVWELVHAVRAAVAGRVGVDLVPELRFVGEFDDPEVEQ